MRSSHGSTHLCVQSFDASNGVCARLTLAALAQSAHLLTLGLNACLQALVYGANLLLLSIAQIKLSHQAHHRAGASAASAATALTTAPAKRAILLLRAIFLLLRRAVLRESGNAERQDEAECQADPG
jgi:hypothetical protein